MDNVSNVISSINVSLDDQNPRIYKLDVYKNENHPVLNQTDHEKVLSGRQFRTINTGKSIQERMKIKRYNKSVQKSISKTESIKDKANKAGSFSLDLGKFTVLDQGNLGSCVCNATASCFEYMFKSNKNNKNFQSLSRLYTYFTARGLDAKLERYPDYLIQDSGLYVIDGIQSLKEYGFVSEKNYRYNIDNFAYNPGLNIYTSSKLLRTLNYISLGFNVTNISQIRNTLLAGHPILCGIAIYENFQSPEVSRTGNVPMPSGALLGGHCILLVAYDDNSSRVKFLNSWGRSWGSGGYGTLPYMYLTSSNASDFIYISKLVI